MPTGYERYNIPVLEPFENDKVFVRASHEVGKYVDGIVQGISISINNIDNFSVTGELTNLKIENLSAFEVTKDIECEYTIFPPRYIIHLNISVPYVNITGDYDLEGFAIQMIPMYGIGPFR